MLDSQQLAEQQFCGGHRGKGSTAGQILIRSVPPSSQHAQIKANMSISFQCDVADDDVSLSTARYLNTYTDLIALKYGVKYSPSSQELECHTHTKKIISDIPASEVDQREFVGRLGVLRSLILSQLFPSVLCQQSAVVSLKRDHNPSLT